VKKTLNRHFTETRKPDRNSVLLSSYCLYIKRSGRRYDFAGSSDKQAHVMAEALRRGRSAELWHHGCLIRRWGLKEGCFAANDWADELT
jgi:hypothetical protein